MATKISQILRGVLQPGAAHAEKIVSKATKWTLLFCRLTKPSTGIKTELMHWLYYAMAVPRIKYVTDVWYTPILKAEMGCWSTGSMGMVHRLTSIQHIATRAIAGSVWTMAADILVSWFTCFPPYFSLFYPFPPTSLPTMCLSFSLVFTLIT